MTGFTSNQVNIRRKKNPLYSGAAAILTALESKHTVINAKPHPSLLDEYQVDALVIGLIMPNALGAYHAPLSMLLAHMATKRGIPVSFYLDDWHIDQLASSLQRWCDPKHTLRVLDFHYSAPSKAELRELVTSNADVICSMYTRLSEFPVLLPVFHWIGDEQRDFLRKYLHPWSQHIMYDPTLVLPWVNPTVPIEPKQRVWALTSRGPFFMLSEQLGLTWPVEMWGRPRAGTKYVPNELDLLDAAYAHAWGVISHPYPVKKTRGQWRNRFMFAAACGNVLGAAPEEIDGLPVDITYDARTIEHLSDGELHALAVRQREALLHYSQPKSEAVQCIQEVILQ